MRPPRETAPEPSRPETEKHRGIAPGVRANSAAGDRSTFANFTGNERVQSKGADDPNTIA